MFNQFICSFFSTTVALTENTSHTMKTSSRLKIIPYPPPGTTEPGPSIVTYYSIDEMELRYNYCPSCEKVAIKSIGIGLQFEGKTWNIYPDSNAKQLPNYIPLSIVQDYEDA